MIPPTDPAEPEGIDLDAYRTANLADPELAAAYEVENEAIRLDVATIGFAWALGLIPFMLVLLLLSAAFGDWAWDLALPLFLAGAVALIFVRMGLFRRITSDLPIHLPDGRVYRGAQKRKLLFAAGAVVAGLWLLHERGPAWYYLQRWVAEWMASGTIEGW